MIGAPRVECYPTVQLLHAVVFFPGSALAERAAAELARRRMQHRR